ncbi:MAG: hypothetical protein E4H01_13215 [Lysobacterales bacterium]|nr:MAG: hypothetical protein E4H01_13215 [Xanthomonadales bacterium]
MNAAKRIVARPNFSPKGKSGGTVRMMKWLALIVLLVLLLLALFLPDRGLAANDARLLAKGSHQGRNSAIQPPTR